MSAGWRGWQILGIGRFWPGYFGWLLPTIAPIMSQMTNGWDVLNDAIKIGVPAIIAAFATIFAVWIHRSNDLKKDQRKRRQDGLERIIDDFEAIHSDTAALAGLWGTYCEATKTMTPAQALEVCRPESSKRFDAYEKTIGSLNALVGRARMLGLKPIAESLVRYNDARRKTDGLITFTGIPDDTRVSEVNAAGWEMEHERETFHSLLNRAFHQI